MRKRIGLELRWHTLISTVTTQQMKLLIHDFFCKCEQIHAFQNLLVQQQKHQKKVWKDVHPKPSRDFFEKKPVFGTQPRYEAPGGLRVE